MRQLFERKSGGVEVLPCRGRSRDDDIGRVGEESSLDGAGDLVGQLCGSNVFCAKGGELFDGLGNLVGKLASRDEDEGGSDGGRVGLSFRLAS